MVPEQIEREVVVDAPVERVWAVITEPGHIGAWFGDGGVEIDLRPGGNVVFRWQKDGSFHGTIERVEPQRFFSYRWTHRAEEQPRDGNTTLVELRLSAEGNGTRLRVVESGFNALDIPEAEQARNAAMNAEGWRKELDELREYARQLAA